MKKSIIIFLITTTLILEYIINKNALGTIVFLTGILSTYFALKSNKLTFIFGLINNFVSAYIFYLNNLNILKTFTIVILIPFQILGMSLKNNKQDKYLKINSKKIMYILILGSIIIINLIFNDFIRSMDLTSSILNSLGLFLMLKGYKDCWYIWLINNVIDLIIWLVLFYLNSSNALIMIIICNIYIVINILGIKKDKHIK